MAEVRTTSSTGGQKGVKPQRMDLVPYPALKLISEVYAFGAEKYADHNWRLKYEWGKSLASLERHIGEFKEGNTFDRCEDDCEFYHETGDGTCRNHSGLHHLAHAGFHVFALLTWFDEDGYGADNPFDDRWPAAMERRRRAQAILDAEPPAVKDQYGVVEPYDDEELSGNMAWVPLVNETQQFEVQDIKPLQQMVDGMIARMWTDIGYVNAGGFGLEWKDPELPTAAGALQSLTSISAMALPVRFTCDGKGVVSDNEETLAQKWVSQYDEEHDDSHRDAVRAYLDTWHNRPTL